MSTITEQPIILTINSLNSNSTIKYTLDESEPGLESFTYSGPFELDYHKIVKVKEFKDNYLPSETSIFTTKNISGVELPIEFPFTSQSNYGFSYIHIKNFLKLKDIYILLLEISTSVSGSLPFTPFYTVYTSTNLNDWEPLEDFLVHTFEGIGNMEYYSPYSIVYDDISNNFYILCGYLNSNNTFAGVYLYESADLKKGEFIEVNNLNNISSKIIYQSYGDLLITSERFIVNLCISDRASGGATVLLLSKNRSSLHDTSVFNTEFSDKGGWGAINTTRKYTCKLFYFKGAVIFISSGINTSSCIYYSFGEEWNTLKIKTPSNINVKTCTVKADGEIVFNMWETCYPLFRKEGYLYINSADSDLENGNLFEINLTNWDYNNQLLNDSDVRTIISHNSSDNPYYIDSNYSFGNYSFIQYYDNLVIPAIRSNNIQKLILWKYSINSFLNITDFYFENNTTFNGDITYPFLFEVDNSLYYLFYKGSGTEEKIFLRKIIYD